MPFNTLPSEHIFQLLCLNTVYPVILTVLTLYINCFRGFHNNLHIIQVYVFYFWPVYVNIQKQFMKTWCGGKGKIMKNTGYISVMLFICIFLICLLTACLGEEDNLGNIDEDLSDRLTEALEFDGGEVKSGEPPTASDSSKAPQLDNIQGEDARLGAPFAFTLESDYEDPENVEKAIVFVEGATKYIEVDGVLLSGIMELVGNLEGDEELRDKDFKIQFALQTDDGLTGEYQTFELGVIDESEQETGEAIAALVAEGETYHTTGRPDGGSSADYPQITELSGPSSLVPGQAFNVILETDYLGTISTAVLSTPGNSAYKEIPVILSAGMVTVSGNLAEDGISDGDRLVFQWALKSDTGTGLFRNWSLKVKSGDAEVDGDNTVEYTDCTNNAGCPTGQICNMDTHTCEPTEEETHIPYNCQDFCERILGCSADAEDDFLSECLGGCTVEDMANYPEGFQECWDLPLDDCSFIECYDNLFGEEQ